MTVKQQKRRGAPPVAVAPAPSPLAVEGFLERHGRTIAVALVLFASIRIIATYTVFSHTYDEPAHIACGMEWLDKGVYRWEPQHPPLARVATALGPYLLGTRCQNTPNVDLASMTKEGLAILYYGHHYDLTLELARLGVLPFFWIACLVVYWWGRRYFSASVAVVAVFLFSFLPPVLAHAGLATTDMALTAFLGAAFLSASDLGGASHPGLTPRCSAQAPAWPCFRSFPRWRSFPPAWVWRWPGISSPSVRSWAGLLSAAQEEDTVARPGGAGGLPADLGRLPLLI